MRRMVGIILSLALACGLLLDAGCVRSPSNQPTTITIWHVYGGQTILRSTISRCFNNTVGVEEGIRVEVAMVSDNKNIHNGIIAAAAGEPGSPKLPDMFVSYPKTVLALPDQSILVDYRDYFTEDELAAFVPAFLEDGEVDGHLVCLPVAKSTELLFVNKTDFDRFSAATGVTLDSLRTWEGLFDACCVYEEWTDSLTPDIESDGKRFSPMITTSITSKWALSLSERRFSTVTTSRSARRSPACGSLMRARQSAEACGWEAAMRPIPFGRGRRLPALALRRAFCITPTK